MRARSTLTRTSGDKKKPAAPAAGKKRGSRLSFEERRAQILAKAVEFFAEFGLTAQTRSLAEACGVSQRLIYRFFPSKAALLAEVYNQAILSPFKSLWLVQLGDRKKPMQQRLEAFYTDYYNTVLTERWLRLFLYASLAEVDMAPNYIATIIRQMLEVITVETAVEQGVTLPKDAHLVHELGWLLHGAVSHFAIRRYLYQAGHDVPAEVVLDMHIRSFLAGFAAAAEAVRQAERHIAAE
ncbi:TetR/AcrR family transcriptional regulator [Ferrovibrio xuzhouensis]|uniref:TetR/AcrR family transcriptional regulator n=1 Tax=Ferrovibrio xuzhouensis TaxID=1576914 RepID=A0ABV7VNN3_9PROT